MGMSTETQLPAQVLEKAVASELLQPSEVCVVLPPEAWPTGTVTFAGLSLNMFCK